jgi:hypothetical protein
VAVGYMDPGEWLVSLLYAVLDGVVMMPVLLWLLSRLNSDDAVHSVFIGHAVSYVFVFVSDTWCLMSLSLVAVLVAA